MRLNPYHVTRKWDGGDLKSFASTHPWGDRTAQLISERWPDVDPYEYYSTEGREVHLHSSLKDAQKFRDEFVLDGEILKVDGSEISIHEGREYPHPVVDDAIDKSFVSKMNPFKKKLRGAA